MVRALAMARVPSLAKGAALVAGPLAGAAVAVPVAKTAFSEADTVDVVLGYTGGFATELGGASAAVTRLAHLVELGNQIEDRRKSNESGENRQAVHLSSMPMDGKL